MLQVTTPSMQCDTPSIAKKDMKQNGGYFFVLLCAGDLYKAACMGSPNFKCLVLFINNLVHTFERKDFFSIGLILL